MRIFGVLFWLGMAVLLIQCGNSSAPEKKRSAISWPQLIKEIEVAWTANRPDSLRYREIKSILDKNGITLQDYRQFYREYTEKNPTKNLRLLTEVEKLLLEDLKQSARSPKPKKRAPAPALSQP